MILGTNLLRLPRAVEETMDVAATFPIMERAFAEHGWA